MGVRLGLGEEGLSRGIYPYCPYIGVPPGGPSRPLGS